MKEVYIRKIDTNEWIEKHFKNQDLIPISDLLSVIEDLTFEVQELKDEILRITSKDDWSGYDYGE